MITIKVRDFRGLERADIECDPIALAAGMNAAGKSSLALAAAAALTGAALPIGGLTKQGAGVLVRTGSAAGAVELRGPNGAARVSWPNCDVSTDGEPPHASAVAAGLRSLAETKPEERARVLSELLRTAPTREEFALAMADAGFDADGQAVTAMWNLIDEKGWDSAYALRKEKGAEFKGRWRQVTGAQYGSRLAETWRPPHWAEELENQTDRELEAAVTDAKTAGRTAMTQAADSDARREILQTEADALDRRLDAVGEAATAMTEIEAEVARLDAELRALPQPDPPHSVRCPHCSRHIVIVQRTLAEFALEKIPEPLSAAELKKIRMQRADVSGSLENARSRAAAAKAKLSAAQTGLELSRSAKADLAKLPAPGAAAGMSVADAEAALTKAEQRLAAFRAKNQADEIRDRISSNESVMAIMAPDGLRARKLGQVLELFNSRLSGLCETAKWKPVTVAADLAISYGSRPYALLSASEQYRVRAAFQVAVAQFDGSQMLVFDAADILDAPTRSGLFAMVSGTGLPALIAMTLSKRDQVPPGARSIAYWIENGIAEPMAAPAQREAA